MEEEIEGRHEPHPEAHPVKPALVDVKRKKKKKDTHKKALTWDEHAIEEHDQLRGTRMKVCNSYSCYRLEFFDCFCYHVMYAYYFTLMLQYLFIEFYYYKILFTNITIHLTCPN